MADFSVEREAMVDQQLAAQGISDPRVLASFRRVPRERFVPAELTAFAYDNGPLPIEENQTISQPYMVAIMTEQLRLTGAEKVLEVGTGSGYQSAILAELAKKVCTVERIAALSARARQTLNSLGYTNIEFIVGDGTEGYAAAAPYDRIIVTAACPTVPSPLIDQLADGGRLVIPLGEPGFQTLTIVTKERGEITTESSLGCVFVPLIGKYGWPSSCP